MIKKLLFLFVFAISANGFAQATADTPPDLSQCGIHLFDLNVQSATILGIQSPLQFTVNYFLSLADANANTNAIENPSAFNCNDTNVIYARVTNTSDNSFATTSFTITWHPIPGAGGLSEGVTACNFYLLPPEVPGTGYFAGPNGTLPLSSGVITQTMTVYSYANNGFCSNENAFLVTIISPPVISQMPDVTVCGSYTLPALPAGQNYHFASGGDPATIIPAGDVITASQTVYVYAPVQGVGCTPSEDSFTVTVVNTPVVSVSNVTACNSYTLPELPFFASYFTGPNGTGTAMNAGDIITQSTTIHVFSQAGFCSNDQSFDIHIGNPEVNPPTPIIVCDPDTDGYAQFDLGSKINEIVNGSPSLAVTFYETQADAQTASNPLLNQYSNIIPNQQTIYVRVDNPDGGCFTVVPLDLIAQACGTISGVVRNDVDNNGCSASDPVASGIDVIRIHGNETSHAYTNAQGEYQFTDVPQGVNTVNVVTGAQINYGTPSPYLQSYNIVDGSSHTTDFCIAPATPYIDASVSFAAFSPARPGISGYYGLTVQNIGNTVLDGTVTLTYDNTLMTFTSADIAPVSTTANTVTFNFSNLPPYQYKGFILLFQVLPPPTVVAGNILAFNATVNTTQTDANLLNNTSVMIQTVVSSLDPNDISVAQGEEISQQQLNDDLTYTVRFQNTGTADAIYVRIENTLDDDLDWTTFRPVSASHAFTAERNGNQVTFRFNNINLPSESADEAGSHGYITYKIKPVASLTVNDLIENSADIYFDLNTPIATNTVTTSLVLLGNEQHITGLFSMYPNPASGSVNIHFDDAINKSIIRLYDIQGKMIIEEKPQMQSKDTLLDISKVQAGLYFVKVEADGKSVVKKLMVE